MARKRKVDPLILQKLADDPVESVRLAVVFNKKRPLPVLLKLVDDEWARIAEVACERVKQKKKLRKAERLELVAV